MLVLSRKIGEKVVIGSSITLTVVEIDGRRIKLAIDAPRDVRILRGELAEWQDPPSRQSGSPTRDRDVQSDWASVPEVRPQLVISR